MKNKNVEGYEIMAHVSIKNISVSPLVCIYFDEHPDGIESIERYGPLYYFRKTARKTLKEKYTYKRFNERKEIIGIEEYK